MREPRQLVTAGAFGNGSAAAEDAPCASDAARRVERSGCGWPRVPLFGLSIDSVTMAQAVERVLAWVEAPGHVTRYVVTPNLDHAVMFQRHAGLRAAYATASLVLADGWPLVAASRWLGRPLPERVTGSDLVPAVFARTSSQGRTLRVFLLGAANGVAERAAANIHARWPGVQVCGCASPPPGFERDPTACARILSEIADARPQLLVVGLGAPKQELWLYRHRHELQVPVGLAVGATIDFLAGHRRRAPRWMRAAGLEWLHRLANEPRRLVGRYARDAWAFPWLLWEQWRGVGPWAAGPAN